MIKDITFGQYFRAKSPIHLLDPRCKILLLVLIIVFVFLAKNFISLAIMVAFVFICLVVSKVPLKMYLKNLKAILPIIIFTAVINIFYGKDGIVLVSFWVLSITTGGILRSLFMATRIVLLIITSSVLTYTTTPNDLTDAIESLFSPLKYLGLKNGVHTLAMMMTIALRFIPTLVEETEKIMNAQKARGADLESGKLVERVKALVPILIPLLISSVRRAYELAEAMECRCYNGGEGRIKMKQLKYSKTDVFAAITVVLVCVLVILVNGIVL